MGMWFWQILANQNGEKVWKNEWKEDLTNGFRENYSIQPHQRDSKPMSGLSGLYYRKANEMRYSS